MAIENEKGATLRQLILRFLDAQILVKSDENRTGLEDLLVESGRAFADALYRYEKANPGLAGRYESKVTSLLKSYNAINAEQSRRDVEAEAIALFRNPSSED